MNLLADITRDAVDPALQLLPRAMDRREARVGMLAIGLQESEFQYRFQVVDRHRPKLKGPARGFWQFELGTPMSRGGVWGVVLHIASRFWLKDLCDRRGVTFHAYDIWQAIENDDILAAGLARLLIFTDARPLPGVDDMRGWWELYAHRCWRPGKPHYEKWPGYFAAARDFVLAAES